MARRQTRSDRRFVLDIRSNVAPIQWELFPANGAEPESASPGEESANAADTGVTTPMWKTRPQRG